MGWSCSKAASEVMTKISNACIAQTGSQNTFKVKNTEFFFEASRKEHYDGAITGSIVKMLPNNMCRKAGSFKINGDGTIERAPKFMKKASLV